MARDLNKVQLTGRLGADPTMRYTSHGSAILTFRVASNRTWRTSSGASHEDTEWFRVVAWDQLAEQCHQLLAKGVHIYVEGRLQTRQWSEADGQTRIATEVVASEVIVLAEGGTQQGGDVRPEGWESLANGSAPRSAARGARRNSRVRPAAPPSDLDASTAPPAISLTEEDLPI